MLKVDHREGKIKELVSAVTPTDPLLSSIVYENLEFGDFQLLHEDNIHFIFERKSIDDLVASIKDGRYTNQKARLLQQFHSTQIVYIIEGTLKFSSTTSNPKEKMIQSAVINTLLRDKIGILQTRNIQDTFELIRGIYQRFAAEPTKYTTTVEKKEQTIVTTSSTDDSKRVYRALLCQIPGMSDKSSSAFLERWNTFAEMYQDLQGLESSVAIQVLSELKVNGRKLSKRIVENVVVHLFTKST